jgi:ribulose-phosphate 3-epimerase
MSWQEWVRGAEIEPSLYAADFTRLGEQIESLLDAGTRVFHFDMGDGRFIEPVTIGPIVIASIAPLIHAGGGVLDCHLMVAEPERHLHQVAEAGGDSVTVHVEACDDVAGLAASARELGLGVGVALNPETPVDAALAVAGNVDLVLCMSIHPGFSGLPFMSEALPRIAALRAGLPTDVHVQVDGGVKPGNLREIHDAGADLLVVGSGIFGAAGPAVSYAALAASLRGTVQTIDR